MIIQIDGKHPTLAQNVRVASNATVAGEVTLESGVSIWYGAVLRGDEDSIHIGSDSNIQDNAVVHADPGYPTTVGHSVTVGHAAILHGCTVEDGALIGMGAILLNGCVVGAGSLVAAGALIPQHMVIPPGSLVMGSPAKVVRALRPDEAADLVHSAHNYCTLAAQQLPEAAQT